MKPNISVVIACYNEEKTIGNCLKSLVDQSRPLHEIIVVDGGSKDKTIGIIKTFSKKYKKIKLIHETGKRSPANARNLGWKASSGDYILFLDADWEFETSFVEDIENHILGKEVKRKLVVKHPTMSSIKEVYRRYSWYGRTMPKYWLKNKTDVKTLFRMLASVGLILLPFFAWNPYALSLLVLNLVFILSIGIKSGIGCYRNSGIVSMIASIPAYIIFMFLSTGIGILSIPILLALGSYATGR